MSQEGAAGGEPPPGGQSKKKSVKNGNSWLAHYASKETWAKADVSDLALSGWEFGFLQPVGDHAAIAAQLKAGQTGAVFEVHCAACNSTFRCKLPYIKDHLNTHEEVDPATGQKSLKKKVAQWLQVRADSVLLPAHVAACCCKCGGPPPQLHSPLCHPNALCRVRGRRRQQRRPSREPELEGRSSHPQSSS